MSQTKIMHIIEVKRFEVALYISDVYFFVKFFLGKIFFRKFFFSKKKFQELKFVKKNFLQIKFSDKKNFPKKKFSTKKISELGLQGGRYLRRGLTLVVVDLEVRAPTNRLLQYRRNRLPRAS